ncbi:MAG: tetratricopeptide repeat protein [Burkholderiales bacterium]|nr:tetratricopeptide repeat protein [Burkholderiales bacterium]
MTLCDMHGTALSTTRAASADAYDQALALFNSFRLDPMAVLGQVLAEDPTFVSGWLMQAGMVLGTYDGLLLGMARESLAAAEDCVGHANARERSLLGALRPWADGDLRRGQALLERHVVDHPRDLFALQLSHLSDLVLGQSEMLRDRIGRALAHWSPADPGYGYVLGMHAFGLEECHEYARAEATGRRAVELNPDDAWAVHAVAHVCEMQGRVADGLEWLTATERDWDGNGLAVHNHWHMALMHLSRGDEPAALALFDAAVTPKAESLAMDLNDASALLWRLMLRGVDVGDRWTQVAALWRAHAAWGALAFSDVHAMLAMVASGDRDAAAEGAAVAAAAARSNETPEWRLVAAPACEALQAFARGRYAECTQRLLPVLAYGRHLGGSHAQRDLLRLTAIEAARRAGDDAIVRALSEQRAVQKAGRPHAARRERHAIA